MENNKIVCQFKELAGNLTPKTLVERIPVADNSNLSNSDKYEIKGISLCCYYSSVQLRKMEKIKRSKQVHSPLSTSNRSYISKKINNCKTRLGNQSNIPEDLFL